jgi:hypothetical protein
MATGRFCSWPWAAAIARYDGIRLVEDSADIETCEGAATIAWNWRAPCRPSTPS